METTRRKGRIYVRHAAIKTICRMHWPHWNGLRRFARGEKSTVIFAALPFNQNRLCSGLTLRTIRFVRMTIAMPTSDWNRPIAALFSKSPPIMARKT